MPKETIVLPDHTAHLLEPIVSIVNQYLAADGQFVVFHNGAPVGCTHDVQTLATVLRTARQSRTISTDVCIAVSNGHLDIWTDSGRVSRPVFIVKDSKLGITDEQVADLKSGRLRWDDLFSLGIIENLSVYEEESALIALRPEKITGDHSHCELDPALILGTLASTIPYPDQSPYHKMARPPMTQKNNMIWSRLILRRHEPKATLKFDKS